MNNSLLEGGVGADSTVPSLPSSPGEGEAPVINKTKYRGSFIRGSLTIEAG